ncbi:MAG: hypothetical protein KatS3mg057_2367 [Herpetosiphonaceae bacterium]|nr:MAG: hypothetical protein KatS3mg057_2367 [Herpetosiphonaceae bacterium]
MPEKVVLPNGLRILTEEMPHTHSVSMGFFTKVGSRYEEARVSGISHFLEHMFFKGTEKRPTAREISEAIEGVGGILNAYTSHDATVYWCKVANIHFERGVDVITDMLRNAVL